MTDIFSAIRAIKADAWVTVNGETVDGIIWHDDNPTNITNEQILEKQVELKADWVAKQYQRDRTVQPERGGYPSIGDQLDMQYHDKVNGTSTWQDAVQAVKDAHPKP